MNVPQRLLASSYPEELADLGEDVPESLWFRGDARVLETRPRVAVIGTRRATSYGLRVTRELSVSLARAGACVVSGLASGIDGAAHRAALEVNGATMAVLGTGLDVTFPSGHRKLQEEIGTRGALLSELEPSYRGMPFTFPRRNRLIAALSQVVLVVEAGVPSGALGTVEVANKLGRTVAAVPGPIDQPQSAGTNRLISDGAQVITSAEDLLALVGLTPPPRTPKADPDSDEGMVWRALAGGSLDLDALCQLSGLPAAQCLAAVTTLEVGGSIECLLTGQIRRR